MPFRSLRSVLVSLTVGLTLGLSLALTGASAAAQPVDRVLDLLRAKGLVAEPATPAAAADAGPGAASDLVLAAMNFLDAPYRRGGKSLETGFDCSGFTRHVFELSLGLALPHRAAEQARDGQLQQVQRQALQPGDLVFFNTLRRAFSHVGIYIGNDRFIHAPRSGSEVRVEDMRSRYWSRRFDGARRATPPLASGTPGQGPAAE